MVLKIINVVHKYVMYINGYKIKSEQKTIRTNDTTLNVSGKKKQRQKRRKKKQKKTRKQDQKTKQIYLTVEKNDKM
jgi:5-methylcytosine-specific restriction endonuclease McrA